MTEPAYWLSEAEEHQIRRGGDTGLEAAKKALARITNNMSRSAWEAENKVEFP